MYIVLFPRQVYNIMQQIQENDLQHLEVRCFVHINQFVSVHLFVCLSFCNIQYCFRSLFVIFITML